MSEKESLILLMVVVFTICLAIMVIFLFILINRYRISLEKRQQQALSNLIIGQDNERERLSRDLHDQLGPHLNGIAAIVSTIKAIDQENQDLITEVKEEIWKANQEVRNISHDLMSTSLRNYGLMEAIRKLFKRNESHGIEMSLKSNTEGDELSDAQISHFYSIVKELVYNTIKHANASKLDISFEMTATHLRFEYSDNGKGNVDFDLKKAGIGMGNIRTRVKLMQGDMDLKMDKGFYLCITIKQENGNSIR